MLFTNIKVKAFFGLPLAKHRIIIWVIPFYINILINIWVRVCTITNKVFWTWTSGVVGMFFSYRHVEIIGSRRRHVCQHNWSFKFE